MSRSPAPKHASLFTVFAVSILVSAAACLADEEKFWAFQRPVVVATPQVRNQAWVKNSIDAFILARLERTGLIPAVEADRTILIRRLSFDLTGLPPTPEEVAAFLRDGRPDAYEMLVQRLLASPHYAERWAQHWLDVVRYADSDGFEYDDARPNAWRYRDWVIRSLNEDLPYDTFVQFQIAGDELAPTDHGALAATGFHRLGPLRLNSGNQDEEKNRQEMLVEMTDAVGAAFLGLTLGCARCHDHKSDPIPQADYYRLQAFFAATKFKDLSLASETEQAAHQKSMEQWKTEISELSEEISDIHRSCRERLLSKKKATLPEEVIIALELPESKRTLEQSQLVATASEALAVTRDQIEKYLTEGEREARVALESKMQSIKQKQPAPLPGVWAVVDSSATAPATVILKRGQVRLHGDIVEPRFPSAAAGGSTFEIPVNGTAGAVGPNGEASTGRRAALARWISSEENPLVARVMVNRLWQHHFGRGLVATPNDFGRMGQRPTHPELLDWLVFEFINRGWSLKSMHRLMVTSATYRQSSVRGGERIKIDPNNKLLSRMTRRRLDAEALRDAVLSAAGTLNPKSGGPGVFVPLSKEIASLVYKGSWVPTPAESEHTRRTIYLFSKRNLPNPLLEAFDSPGKMVSCAVRPISTHTGQALALLNSPFLNQQSRTFALRLLLEQSLANRDPDDPLYATAIIDRATRLALGRPPSVDEVELSRRFIERQTELLQEEAAGRETRFAPSELPDGIDADFAEALTDFTLVMLNRDEFLFVD